MRTYRQRFESAIVTTCIVVGNCVASWYHSVNWLIVIGILTVLCSLGAQEDD